MNKSRVEAFTDAIVAIAATIMVLELKVPENNKLNNLLKDWPIFMAYVISFMLIYIIWYEHHNIFYKAKIISERTYFINGIWLFLLTLVPFFTHWVGEYPNSSLPEFFYTLNLLLWSISGQALENQVLKDNNSGNTSKSTDSFKYRLVLYIELIIALVISLFWPMGCLIILILILILKYAFYLKPTKQVHK